MTTMHNFYRQFSTPALQDSYVQNLAALAQYSLAHVRALKYDENGP